tara:strand:+ start:298 stop:411 length:114 start_codon:yes stop_codon:yes gene_type:complete
MSLSTVNRLMLMAISFGWKVAQDDKDITKKIIKSLRN